MEIQVPVNKGVSVCVCVEMQVPVNKGKSVCVQIQVPIKACGSKLFVH